MTKLNHAEPDAWAKIYGDRQGEPLTPIEQWTVDMATEVLAHSDRFNVWQRNYRGGWVLEHQRRNLKLWRARLLAFWLGHVAYPRGSVYRETEIRRVSDDRGQRA